MADTILRPEPVEHSKLGASSSNRWMNCPGSLKLIEKLLADGHRSASSPAAAEGTAAHLIAAAALAEGSDASEYIGMQVEVEDWIFEVDKEMADYLQEYIDFVRAIVEENEGAKLYVETNLGPSKHHPLAFGQGDVVIHIPNSKLVIVDLKFGRGLVVEPHSTQLKIYGHLATEKFLAEDETVEKVELWIAQPRIPHSRGTIRQYITTAEELNEWFTGEVVPRMELALNPKADTLVVGDWCRFCPVGRARACPALEREVFEFDVALEPSHLSDDKIGEILAKKKAITTFFELVEKEALRRAIQGSHIPGRKLVRKTGHRVFKEGAEDIAALCFGDEVYEPRKLRSPASLEKIEGGAEFVKEWAYSPDRGLTLASEDDRKPGVRDLWQMAKDQGIDIEGL